MQTEMKIIIQIISNGKTSILAPTGVLFLYCLGQWPLDKRHVSGDISQRKWDDPTEVKGKSFGLLKCKGETQESAFA